MSSHRQVQGRRRKLGTLITTCLSACAGAAMLLTALASTAMAQGTTGTVTGTVKDQQGSVIPGATVTLISEARGTKLPPVVSNGAGDFVFPDVTADTYTLQIEMPSFKTLKRSGVAVSPGSRVAVGSITIEVGGTTEIINVKGEIPVIQSASGERSFTVATESVASLPFSTRDFQAVINLAPGVSNGDRIGGGGDNNFMMDGITAMETGSNRLVTRVSVESVAEVKVVTSSYQAEYGRSSGLQINAVTKSGTNRFSGSVYDVERKSAWGPNSKVNKLNGDPKPFSEERDWGFTIGGPIGKPGANNKLFFFYNQEFNPRTSGNTVVRYRVPTLLERRGDFSQTTDNLGAPFPYIRDPRLSGTCSATSQAACFNDGGVLGRIPQDRLYQTGLNILNWWPEPNIANVPAGQAYNFELTQPALNLIGWQPVLRLDYAPLQSLRGTFKYLEYQQPNDPIEGTIPGFNDTRQDDYGIYVFATTINWSINSSTFVEASWGANYHHQEGCSILGGSPNVCRSALPVNPAANRITSGMGAIPYLFPDANVINPQYFGYDILNKVRPTIWDGTRIQKVPDFTWGGRVANPPPNIQFPGFILNTTGTNIAINLTKVYGSHTLKVGFYRFTNDGPRGSGNAFGQINFSNDANNPIDSQFGYSNAALGIFSNYSQTSRWTEGRWTTLNVEEYIQDNWKIGRGLTLDYGVRFVYQKPQYDPLGQVSNFLPEEWQAAAAPKLYVAGCANGVYPCTGANRQAMNPVTGQFLGPNSTVAIGTIVPGSGNTTNGLFLSGQGIAETGYTWPRLAVAPRVGFALDPKGDQEFVVRGGGGLFFDRPDGNSIYGMGNNPPGATNVTVRYGQLQDLSTAGLTTVAPAQLSVFQYKGGLPSSTQWNAGVQMRLPWSSSLDASYTGQHSFNTLNGVNINSLDLGLAFLPEYQDRTQAPSATPGASSIVALNPDVARAMQGYAAINQQQERGWRTFHSIQLSYNRRFSDGFSFGFNDTISLYDHQSTAARLQHGPDGSYSYRADQAEADALLGRAITQRHLFKANFVWSLPHLKSDQTVWKAVGLVINDWQLAGVWSGATGTPYTVNFTYQNGGNNVNLTGSPDFTPRVRVMGDPGSGCSDDIYRQFNTGAFEGPLVGSNGLESGNAYVRGCFTSVLDLSISRTIRLGGTRNVQLRVDMFNAPNSAIITGRNSSMSLNNPSDPTTIRNLPYDANGNLIPSLSLPRGAGFGVATNYQAPRTIQAQIRFSF